MAQMESFTGQLTPEEPARYNSLFRFCMVHSGENDETGATNSKPYFAEAIAVEDGNVSLVGLDSEVLRLKITESRVTLPCSRTTTLRFTKRIVKILNCN
jgi:hypothetical protein